MTSQERDREKVIKVRELKLDKLSTLDSPNSYNSEYPLYLTSLLFIHDIPLICKLTNSQGNIVTICPHLNNAPLLKTALFSKLNSTNFYLFNDC